MIVKKVWTVFYIDNLWWFVWIYIEVIWSNYRVVNIIIQVLQGNLIKNLTLSDCLEIVHAGNWMPVLHILWITLQSDKNCAFLGSNLEIYSM